MQPRPRTTLSRTVQRRHRGPRSEANWARSNQIDALNQGRSDELNEQFYQISICSIKQQNRRDTKIEAFVYLNITLPNRSETHKLEVKVDTRAESNTLPLFIFYEMFPEKVNSLPDSIRQETAILTANNRASIPKHRSANIMTAQWQLQD